MGEYSEFACPDCGSLVHMNFILLGSFGNPLEVLDSDGTVEVFLLGLGMCKFCSFKTGGDKKFATVRLMYDMDFRDWCICVASGLQVVILNKGEPP